MSVVTHFHSIPTHIPLYSAVDDHYVIYGNGVPANFRLGSILDQWFVRVERTYNDLVAPGDRLLARSQQFHFQDSIFIVEHICTKVSYLTSYGTWIRHSVVTLEGQPFLYPYDIDPIHAEGESSPLLAPCDHGQYCLNCQSSTYALTLLEENY
jgi:hypothetical protein